MSTDSVCYRWLIQPGCPSEGGVASMSTDSVCYRWPIQPGCPSEGGIASMSTDSVCVVFLRLIGG